MVGQRIAGPAIIEERESTTVIGRLDQVSVDAIGCLVITLGSERTEAAAPRRGELVIPA